jgi:hypothetical protein
MGRLKDRNFLDTDGGEFVDVKEAAIVDLLTGDAPKGETVDLGVDQCVEAVKALRETHLAVVGGDDVIE